jgi:hypothetical protein
MKKSNNDLSSLVLKDLVYLWELFCPYRSFPRSMRHFLDQMILAAKARHQDCLDRIGILQEEIISEPITEILSTLNTLYYLKDHLEDFLNACQTYYLPLYQQKKIQHLIQKVQKTYWKTEAMYDKSVVDEIYADNLVIQSLISTGGEVLIRGYVPHRRYKLNRRFPKQDLN